MTLVEVDCVSPRSAPCGRQWKQKKSSGGNSADSEQQSIDPKWGDPNIDPLNTILLTVGTPEGVQTPNPRMTNCDIGRLGHPEGPYIQLLGN